ncbi:MAG TPA: hypothetical protein VGS18_04130, partial [Thermoplasmata archaeon]|nr:hypothetical protein [Thermoplasmata archaeon]
MIDLGTLPLALLAAAMAASTAWLLRWASEARGPIAAGTIVFLLVMMAAMLLGALVYLLSPGRLGLVEGLWISAAVMSASVFPLFLLILRAARAASGPAGGPPGSPPLERPPPIVVASLIGLVLVNELLMGWTFSLAADTPIGTGGPIAILVGSVDSPWFLFTMAA